MREIILADYASWLDFARENHAALIEAYGTIGTAYRHAVQGGLTLGGGASPLFFISFSDDDSAVKRTTIFRG